MSKKTRLKKLACWLLIDLTVAAIIFALLLHKPGRYNPVDFDSDQVSPYLTHELLPKIHNESQLGEPFDVIVTQDGINEIVAELGWPMVSEGIMLYAPAVLFEPGSVVLMGTANLKNVEFVVTIVLEPKIDEQGLLNLQVAKVKVGAMNITPLAKMVAGKMYAERLDTMRVDTDTLQAQIAASLLNDEPFEPVFEVEDRKMRIEKVTIHEEKLMARLIPAS
ncbi:MAG: hypothetical protein ACYS80_00305 [Planctomycetota bacterium]|jgi:uncharacterized protein YpmS